MKGLSKKDEQILKVLKDYPQGLALWQITKFAKIERKEYTRYYMNKLIGKGYVKKANLRYFLIIKKEFIGSINHITQRHRTQRLHDMQINAGLYKTSADNLSATFQALGIPFTEPVPKQYIVVWKGVKLKFTTKKIISFAHSPELPQAIPGEPLRAAIMAKHAVLLEELLDYTGIRCIRKLTGELMLEFRYWENGFPENDIAQETLKEDSRIVYAYSSITGKASIWADSSVDPFKELETNSRIAEKEFKLYFQAIDDGFIKPYEDELRTRRDMVEIKKVIELQTQTQLELKGLVVQLSSLVLSQQSRPEPESKKGIWT